MKALGLIYFSALVAGSVAGLVTGLPDARGEMGADFPKRRPKSELAWVGEKQEFSVSFLGFTGLHVEIEVLPQEIVGSRKSYHVRAKVRNSDFLGIFYNIDDTAETWIDYEGLFSHRFHLVQNESKLSRESWENHDHAKGETSYRNLSQRKGEKAENSQVTSRFPTLAQDSFSSFYFLRTLPLEIGESYRIPVVSEGNSIEVQATVEGVDLISSLGSKVQALQIRLQKLDKNGNTNPGQNNLVWLSNDERRILLRVDVTTRFGHIVGDLKNFRAGTPSSENDVRVSAASATDGAI